MKKLVLIMFVILASVSLTFAMDARKSVLNPDDPANIAYENTSSGLFVDSADSFMNPVYMLDYANTMGFDMGSTVNPSDVAGFVFIEPKIIPGVLGVQVGRIFGAQKNGVLTSAGDNIDDIETPIPGVIGPITMAIAGGANFTDLSDVRSWGLLYALPIGEKMRVGLAINSIGNSVEGPNLEIAPTANYSKSMGIFEVRLGLLMDMEFAKIAADLGINMPSYKYEEVITAGGGQSAEFAPMNIDLNVRLSKNLGECLDGVLLIQLATFGGDLEMDPDTATANNMVTEKISSSVLNILVGPSFTGEDSKVGFLIGFGSKSFSDETTLEAAGFQTGVNNQSTSYFPTIQLIGEKAIAKWITMNGSVVYAAYRESSEDCTTTIGDAVFETKQEKNSIVNLNLGTVITLGSFVIEGNMAQNLYFNGPYFASGTASAFNALVSVGYKFGCKS